MAHVFALALTAFIIYLAKPGTSLFSWHPTFMILGFGLFMFEAILIFSPHSSLLASSDRATKVKWHWILNVLANLFIFLGFAAIYYNKDLNSKPHFTTWHGQLGLFSVLTTVLQSICAVSLIYYNVKWLNPLGITLRLRKQLHAVFGALSYVIGYVTLVLSLYSNFVAKNTTDNTWYTLLVLVTVVASVVVNQVSAAYLVKPGSSSPATGKPGVSAGGVPGEVTRCAVEPKVKSHNNKSKSPLSYDYSPPIRRRSRWEGNSDVTSRWEGNNDVTKYTHVKNFKPERQYNTRHAEQTQKSRETLTSKKETVSRTTEKVTFDQVDSEVFQFQSTISTSQTKTETAAKCDKQLEAALHANIFETLSNLSSGDNNSHLTSPNEVTSNTPIQESLSEVKLEEPLKTEKEELDLETSTTKDQVVEDNDLITPPPSPHEVVATSGGLASVSVGESAPIEQVTQQQQQQPQQPRFPRRTRKTRNIDGTIPWESIAL